jgi:sulfide:quinone oxidoreductase
VASFHSKRVVVVGSSFAGLTAALELRRQLDHQHEVVVLDPRPEFTFIPSLIWLPFGIREAKDVTFPLAPVYRRKGIRFVNEAAVAIDLDGHTVTAAGGELIAYDKLFIGTGPRLAFEKVKGLGPHDGYTQSVCNLEHAELARDAWQQFLREPGPVVIGTAQGGSCFGASYEFLFNVKHQIKKAGLAHVAPVTFITAEPYLGHFGLGGVGASREKLTRFLEHHAIEGLANSSIKEARRGEIELDGGRTLPFAYSMIVPPFTGVDVVAQTPGLANQAGFIPVDDLYRHPEQPDVYSAGVAIALKPPDVTPVPAGVPKTGQMTETMAKVAAHNIAAEIASKKTKALPLADLGAICILDAGDSGVAFKAKHILARNGATAGGKEPSAVLTAGPHAHLAKIAFEQIFLTSRKRGLIVL